MPAKGGGAQRQTTFLVFLFAFPFCWLQIKKGARQAKYYLWLDVLCQLRRFINAKNSSAEAYASPNTNEIFQGKANKQKQEYKHNIQNSSRRRKNLQNQMQVIKNIAGQKGAN